MSLNIDMTKRGYLSCQGPEIHYRTHAPSQNPTAVGLHLDRWRRTYIAVTDVFAGVSIEIKGVTVRALLDALLEDDEIRAYLASGVEHFKQIERNAV